MNVTTLWALWLHLVLTFRPAFTVSGERHFVTWVTGTLLNPGDHTLVQAAAHAGQEDTWKTLHAFVSQGHWQAEFIDTLLTRRIAQIPERERLWYGFHVHAIDDTKTHRNSPFVWGICTFHNYSARCPNRAATVRAHNWVVLGTLLPALDEFTPATFVPQTAELYCRSTQLPPGRTFHTKDAYLVQMCRQQADNSSVPHLAVFDGGYAHRGVVRSLVQPEAGQPRIDFVTRLRVDSCLYEFPPENQTAGRRPRVKGACLPKPRAVEEWPDTWQEREMVLYQTRRHVRYLERVCLWSVAGWRTPVRVVLARVSGYSQLFTLVSSATRLSGEAILQVFCARFRQEDGFRDLKQELGWEEGRYTEKEAVLKTTQVTLVSLALVRLLERELQRRREEWWACPPWYPKKWRPSVRDVLALFRSHAEGIGALLSDWRSTGREPIEMGQGGLPEAANLDTRT